MQGIVWGEPERGSLVWSNNRLAVRVCGEFCHVLQLFSGVIYIVDCKCQYILYDTYQCFVVWRFNSVSWSSSLRRVHRLAALQHAYPCLSFCQPLLSLLSCFRAMARSSSLAGDFFGVISLFRLPRIQWLLMIYFDDSYFGSTILL